MSDEIVVNETVGAGGESETGFALDDLAVIATGSFDVVPAVKLLALRLQQLERDVAHLSAMQPVEDAASGRSVPIGAPLPGGPVVVAKGAAEPAEDTKPRATSKQRASGKGA